jgi:hypothetical protein
MQKHIIEVSVMARAAVLSAAITLGASCSAPSGEMLDSVQEADALLPAAGAVLPAPRSVKILRPGAALSARALDSQNALPSGVLADSTVRRRLELLSRQNLAAGAGTLRAIPKRLVTYLARCALAADDALVFDGNTYDGRLGLVPDWQSRTAPLEASERRWLTACLMAHANDLASVDIAVAGEHTAFSRPPAADAPTWSFEEAAFYGDVFTQGKAALFACLGAASAARCDDGQVAADIARRICGSHSADCGFTFAGPCDAGTPPTCESHMPYAACVQRAAGSASANPVRTEVMSVFLRTSADLQRLHPTAACTQ